MALPAPSPGLLIAERYRLVEQLSDGSRGELWRAEDQCADGALVALRRLEPGPLQGHWREILAAFEGLSLPQLPHFGPAIERGDDLWLVRPWQTGRSLAELLEERRARQQAFSSREVVSLLRQLLPLLGAVHDQNRLVGDLTPANLLCRNSDGLPLLLDLACSRQQDSSAAAEALNLCSATASEDLQRGDPAEPWMDLHALGVLALELLGGELQPEVLDSEPDLQRLLERLRSSDPAVRFHSAAQALEALDQLPAAGGGAGISPAFRAGPAASPAASRRFGSRQQREDGQEGGLWPVVFALLAAALLGTTLGWWWLGRSRPQAEPQAALPAPQGRPAAEDDQRQQLLSRLRALEVDPSWFFRLLEASLQARNPADRTGLAEQWLARIESLPLELRRRLGSFSDADLAAHRRRLVASGVSQSALNALVTAAAGPLLPGQPGAAEPPEPYRQLWFATAELTLADLRLGPIALQPRQPRVLSAEVASGSARPFLVRLPPGHQLVLGANGSALLEMAVYAADGAVAAQRGPLRVVRLGRIQRSPVQLLVFNTGLAPALVTLSLRADPPQPRRLRMRPPLPPPAAGATPSAPGGAG